jgi:nitronate monooxygenase
MAPMFLVTNEKMMIAAGNSGIAGCIPALNWRTIEELKIGIQNIRAATKGPIGINLIVNKSNPHYKKQLEACIEAKVDFFITSLGSPEEVINKSKEHNIKVFCDVTDLEYAKKVEALGADALIAVNSGAGGHLGNIPASVLIPMLTKECKIPVISAGGVGTGSGLLSMLALGATGISMGSPFIATTEAQISEEYKNACINYGAKDIVVTTKLSGSRCTVINSDYVKKIGVEQNPIEKLLNTNKKIKKYAKMLTFYKGMKLIEKAAFSATYKTIWCAGTSIEFVKEVRSCSEIVENLWEEYKQSCKQIKEMSCE